MESGDEEEPWLLSFFNTVGEIIVSLLFPTPFAFTNTLKGKSAERKELSAVNVISSNLFFRYEGEITHSQTKENKMRLSLANPLLKNG